MKKLLKKNIGILCLFTTILFFQCASVTQKQTDETDIDSSLLIPVRVGNNYGYIDKNGKYEILPKFLDAEEFVDGYAVVCTEDGEGTINKQGEYVIEPQSQFSIEMREGSGKFVMHKQNNYRQTVAAGLVDYSGIWSLSPIKCGELYYGGNGVFTYSKIMNPSQILHSDDIKRGIIINGVVQQPIFEYDCSIVFQEGLSEVIFNNKYGYIDSCGKMAINPIFDYAYSFSKGLARVRYYGWKFIDKTGKIILSLPYDEVKDFSEGLAAVKNGKRWGYINKKGDLVIPLQFPDEYIENERNYGFDADDFCGGIVRVCFDNGKFGVIDKKGKTIVPPEYDYIKRITTDNIKVEKDGKCGVINKKGKTIVPLEYDDLRITKDYVIVKQNEKFGLIDKKGKILFEPKFGYIGIWGEVIFAQEKLYGQFGIIDREGNWIAVPQFDDVSDWNARRIQKFFF